MRATQHPSNNQVMVPPVGAAHDQFGPLAVTLVRYVDGVLGIRSYWQPDAADLARLMLGEPICLEIQGAVMAPVSLYVGEPR